MGPASVAIPGVEVLEELGRGAHGAVYRVRRNTRYYAAKVPLHPASGADAEVVARRFLREGVALARVRHRALPRVLEVGRGNGAPYLILELSVGETLAERLRSGPLDEHQVLEIAIELADALACIHQSGLSHRDISTSNILFDAATTAVRLVDFGFADSMEVGEGEAQDATPFATFAEARADLHALGRVLFECLTGKDPLGSVEPVSLLARTSPGLSRLVERLLGYGNEVPYTRAWELGEDLRQLDLGASSGTRPLSQPLATSSWPLLGRDRELERLRAARRSSAGGRCLVVLVRGVLGSGKSSLLREFAKELASSGATWFAVSFKSAERVPFGVVRQIVEALLDELDRLSPGKRLAKLAELRAVAGEMAPLLRLLSPRLARVFPDATPLPRGEGAEHIFSEGLTEFLLKLFADLGPTVVLVDDVQWLDAGSRRVLGRLTDRGASSLLLVLSGRDDAESRPCVEQLTVSLDPERLWELGLEPFEEPRIVELVQGYLGADQVTPELVRGIVTLSDGTPLSVLEVLRSMLEAGILLPYWGEWKFDARAASSMGLPRGSLELVSRRISGLDPMSVRVLSAAAVFGTRFDAATLGRVCGVSPEVIHAILLDARRGVLVEPNSNGSYHFTHDSVRDALLERIGPSELRMLHEDIAEALEAKLAELGGLALPSDRWLLGNIATLPDVNEEVVELNEETETERVELVFALAGHYVEGERTRHPERVAAACSAAGRLAFRTFDNEPALKFFEVANEAERSLGREPELNFLLLMAEVRLRTGALEAGLVQLRAVVERSPDPVVQAFALSRIAWAEAQADAERAWDALREAFRVLGIRALNGNWGAWLAPVQTVIGRAFARRVPEQDLTERRRLTVIAEIYYEAARLALETEKSGLAVEASLKILEPAERLGTSATLNKAYLACSFILAIVGMHEASRRYLERAYSVAAELRSPTVTALTLQVHTVIADWRGDFRESSEIGARLLGEYGHWRELGDYCLLSFNQGQVESVRGRSLEAWKWIERALGKLTKYEGTPSLNILVELAVRAALTSLGREQEADRVLLRLGNREGVSRDRGSVLRWTYGARVRLFTEKAELGPEFEAIVEEVREKKFDPRRVHLMMAEYYVHVAHARVHACLRATPEELADKRKELTRALAELKRSAKRLPPILAHAAVVSAYEAFFRGDLPKAERFFAKAEVLGRAAGVPWVLYSVHRGRAHVLLRGGRLEEARDQARLAEAIAREHGAVYRMRWVREEFSLGRERGTSERGSNSPKSLLPPRYSSPSDAERPVPAPKPRGYLRSLVQIGHASAKELELQQQVRVVLDELIEVLRAERGYLFLGRARLLEEQGTLSANRSASDGEASSRSARTPAELAFAAGRSASGEDLPETGFDPKLVEDLWAFGNLDVSDDGGLPGVGTAAAFADRVVVATPLVVRGGRLGVVYLDRPVRAGPFSDLDARLLSALGGQVSLVIELARSLRLRERAEETQRSTEKLEAIGRLAGGIAHDFNNMLSVILGASEQILSEGAGHRVEEDVETIRSAAERARDLTQQLLAFSRGQYLNPEVLDLNQLVRRLEPIFRRLASSTINLEIRLDPELCRIKADPAQIDQVLTNLVVNACDAMPTGGKLLIETRRVIVSPPRLGEQAVLHPGCYARIVVSDDGRGMDQDTRTKAFEPFFTTKPHGSGLGLATAYGIVTQSGGHIELESELGVGTTFRMFFPETVQRLSAPPPAILSTPNVPRGSETILLVDDEPLVRESTRRILSSLGYTVIAAKNSEDALKIANERPDIELVISDVIMPGMNGLELARELAKIRPGVPVLFVSGFTAGVLTERGVFRETVEFLQKPVALETLASRIRSLVEPTPLRQREEADSEGDGVEAQSR